MNNALLPLIIAVIIFVLMCYGLVHCLIGIKNLRVTPKKKKVTDYNYTFRKSVMTKSEKAFFRRLEKICADKYYVFPQIHLSSVLDEKVKGQNWAAAFKYINNWSVDYVLCDKTTLETVYAIELDDPTHKKPDRVERDKQKDEILALAGVPLVRFSDVNSLSDQDIIEKFVNSKL